MVFLPFSMYMIVFKFVCRKIVSCTVSRIVINIYNRLVYKIPVPEQTDRSRNSSGNQTDIIGSRNLSGNSEPRSRNNSGNRLRNSFEADNRSRHNSGQEVRSRHGSGNESRSRHSSGNTPGPGLLQRSDSIVQFPASPPGSASIGGRSRRSSSSSSSGVNFINVLHEHILYKSLWAAFFYLLFGSEFLAPIFCTKTVRVKCWWN